MIHFCNFFFKNSDICKYYYVHDNCKSSLIINFFSLITVNKKNIVTIKSPE